MKDIYKLGLGFILVIVASAFLLRYLVIYLLPFLIAIILASLIEPAVKYIGKKAGLSRGLSVAIVLIVILIVVGLLFTVFVSRLFIELDELIRELPDYRTVGDRLTWLVEQNQRLGEMIEEWEMPETVRTTIDNSLQEIYDRSRRFIQFAIASVLDLARRLPTLITTLLISLIATFFLSKDKELIIESYLAPFPKEWQEKIRLVQDKILSSAVGFIRAYVILISITTVLAVLGLTILGSNYALVVGVIAGILDLIPVIGPGLALIPLGIYSLLIGEAGFGMGVLALYGIIAVTRQLSEAKIVGESIGVHPVLTLLSIYLGVQILGVIGVFLGPAVVIVVKAVLTAGLISFIIPEKN